MIIFKGPEKVLVCFRHIIFVMVTVKKDNRNEQHQC